MTPWVLCKNAVLRTGEQWFARRSLARTIILSIGITLVTMQLIVTGVDVLAARRGIEALSAKRGGAALDMLTALHTQAMLNRSGTGDTDPAISTLNGSMKQFSQLSQDVQLWVVMGAKVEAYQHLAGAREIERPRDATDRQALVTAKTQISEQDGRLRLSRPVLAGSGSAAPAACAGCHQDLMGIGPGEVIGVYSAEVDMRPELLRWRQEARDRALVALATTAATLALVSLLLHLTTLRPLARLSHATRKLAQGDLEARVTDTERPDALGEMARALTVFRAGLIEKRALETRNAFLARHDSLTSLPNRASFSDHLDDALILARARGHKVGVIGIDLNRFKEINDRHGHAVGDEVLKVLAGRMSALLTEGEFVARFGGDEFAATKTFRKPVELTDFVTRLERALFETVRLEALDLPSGASLGVAIYPHDALSRDPLLSNADLAMYRAKASHGVQPVCYYEPAMDEASRHRRQMASDLKSALELGQFSLHYQVQKAVATGEIVGYEALLRWVHPKQGSIPPDVFIGIAEDCGAILEIGEWVLRTACLEAAQWPGTYRVAVNLSPAQLLQPDLVQRIHAILLNSALPPRRLELEITESMVIGDKAHALHVLRQIKALGISVAMDDFGTGYASLDTLNAFPFDKIKIDRSFLAEAGQRPQARSIIRAILALGRSLGIPVLAEGVETAEQLALLEAEGCLEAQGYLFGRPQPMADILASAAEVPDLRLHA